MQGGKGGDLKIIFEEPIEDKATIWFHPTTSLVCTINEKNQVRLNNFESGKCITVFDLFSGAQLPSGELKTPKHFVCIDVVFVDKQALLWSSGSSDVATGLVPKLKTLSDMPYLILLDRTTIVRWEYMEGRWAFAEVMIDSRVPATKAILYDDNHIVLGYEDGTIRLYNFLTNYSAVVIKDKHESSICCLLTFARDLQSKPLVLSAERDGQIFCWNMDNQQLVFKFAEMSKGGKSVSFA